jgi:coenzyme F420 hydrogenase subunit delta
LFDKSTLVFGWGNILFGDDGFGPAVVKYLQDNYPLPEEVLALDAGTSYRAARPMR